MLTALVVIAVLGILFGTAALATWEGNVLTDAIPDDRDARLPESALQPEDVGELRFDMAVRGYRMAEVDSVLVRLAAELAARDARIAHLERALAEGLEPLVSAAERSAAATEVAPEQTPELHDPLPSHEEADDELEAPVTAVDDSAFSQAVEPVAEPVAVDEPAAVEEHVAALEEVPTPVDVMASPTGEVIPDPPLELPEDAASAPAAISGPLTGTTWWDEAVADTPHPSHPETASSEPTEPTEPEAAARALDAFAFPELHPPEPELAAATPEPTAAEPTAPEPVLTEADRWWAGAQAAEPPYRG